MLDLDTLLIQIRGQVTPKWDQFGAAVGINQETLDELSKFNPEERIIEMLDLWLRTNETAITWRDVADALKNTGLYLLAEKILKVYKTGTCLVFSSKEYIFNTQVNCPQLLMKTSFHWICHTIMTMNINCLTLQIL